LTPFRLPTVSRLPLSTSALFALLARLGIEVETKAVPFGVPMTTPFAEDTGHASYDRAAVERYWQALRWIDWTFQEFAGWFCGKTSPVHLFWHGFDLAVTRFSGARGPQNPDADPVTREAYSHEVVSFGVWPGDQKVRMPAFYSYTAPEPAGLAEQSLRPEAARWAQPFGSSHFALLAYEEVLDLAPTRARPCSTSWRAPTRLAPRSPAGIATRCARPGARRRP
jgi:hypothetical protein